MADEDILDEEIITTVKKEYTGVWKISHRILQRRSFDLKYWIIREVLFTSTDSDVEEATKLIVKEVGDFIQSCNYNLFSIREFDGQRKEKYGD